MDKPKAEHMSKTVVIELRLNDEPRALGFRIEPKTSENEIRRMFHHLMNAAWSEIKLARLVTGEEARYSPVFWDIRQDRSIDSELFLKNLSLE